jgi:CRP/FNR family transcriptional regulator, cyclic AMP receptor protein
MADDSIAFDLLATVETAVRSFRAGDVIFNEGDLARESYVIQKGQVEIRRHGRLLDTLMEKSIFGEMALIDHAPRAATAIAATDVVLVPVAEKQFLFLVGQTPYFRAERDAGAGAPSALRERGDVSGRRNPGPGWLTKS